MRAVTVFLLLALPTSAQADFLGYAGYGYAHALSQRSYHFDVAGADYLQLRVTIPYYTSVARWSTYNCYHAEIAVTDDWGSPLPESDWSLTLYNEGYENRGGWITVDNTDRSLGRIWINVYVYQEVESSSGVLQTTLPLFTHGVTSYCRPTEDIRSDSPLTAAARSEAINRHYPDHTIQEWGWGQHEAVSLWIAEEFTYTVTGLSRSSDEVLASRYGDCNDLAVIYCALARRSGIPSRPAATVALDYPTGTIYRYPDDGFHMIAQVWDGNTYESACWVDVGSPMFGEKLALISDNWMGTAADPQDGLYAGLVTDGAVHLGNVVSHSLIAPVSTGLYVAETRPAPGPNDLLSVQLAGVYYEPPGAPGSPGSGLAPPRPVTSVQVSTGAPPLAVWPNPFNPEATITFPGTGVLAVFDSSGRFVRAFGRVAGSVVWDGKDARGIEAPSGVYFFRFVSPAGTASFKGVLAR